MKAFKVENLEMVEKGEVDLKEVKKALRQLLQECSTGQATPYYFLVENAMTRLGDDPNIEDEPLVETGEQVITLVFSRIKGPWEHGAE